MEQFECVNPFKKKYKPMIFGKYVSVNMYMFTYSMEYEILSDIYILLRILWTLFVEQNIGTQYILDENSILYCFYRQLVYWLVI